MRILVVSSVWPIYQKSGVSLAAALHVRLLAELGHQVYILGTQPDVKCEALPTLASFCVSAKGTGALYSPIKVDRRLVRKLLKDLNIDLIMIEAWQTALSNVFIDEACVVGVPAILISHGISVFPYRRSFVDYLRSIGWLWYRFVSLPVRIKRLHLMTTLDLFAKSDRFYDRDLAKQFGVPCLELTNTAYYIANSIKQYEKRKKQIIVLGYYSRVKNQLDIIKLLAKLPDDVRGCFIGPRRGRYYQKCLMLASSLGILERVQFLEDDECNVAEEIADSLIMLNMSITEVLPISLLEAMANGTPFVAKPVGAVRCIGAGCIADSEKDFLYFVNRLLSDKSFWQEISRSGLEVFRKRYSLNVVKEQLARIVANATD